MYRFYVTQGQIQETEIVIVGQDVDHIKRVLRMKTGEEVVICNGQGKDYVCSITEMSNETITLKILSCEDTISELQTRITLFQGLPKKDKMELIVQKAVELGAYEIIPVMTKRTIVKLDDKKKEQKKIERWQTIATAAAKQSGRGIIPQVKEVMTYQGAIAYAKTLDYNIIPFEHEEGMKKTRENIKKACEVRKVGIFIGPEGGFEDSEIEAAKREKIEPITLGKRILRTETAGLTTLSILMYELESK